MNRQIEELANFLCSMETYDNAECEKCGKWDNDCCDELCFSRTVATDLYNAGYRKASEVAREIFEEIEKAIYHLKTPVGKYLVINSGRLADLKKKYESEGGE